MAMLDETSAVGFEAVVELQGDIDEEALGEAWRRLAVRHPILSCVRRKDTWQPTGSPPLGPDVSQPRHEDPPVGLRLTAIPGGMQLAVLCNHVAFDGMASVVLLRDLSEEYHAVLAGAAAQATDWSPRTLEAVVDETLQWRTVAAAAMRGFTTWWQTPPSTHVDPEGSAEAPASEHALMELGPVLEALAPHRRKYRWSTDAVLVGVLEKAWTSVFGPPTAASSWLVAQDLRPALGVTRGIGNLSLIAGLSIPDPRSDLFSVIDGANAMINARADELVSASAAIPLMGGLAEPSFVPALRRSDKRRHHRSVSNVGQLADTLDGWGSASLQRVWFVGPLADPPYTSFIAAGHGPSTLVSVRTSPHWLTLEHARGLEQAALEFV